MDFTGEAEVGWWWGRSGRRLGVFPSHFVEMLYDEEATKAEDRKVRCQVLFSYQPAYNDELELHVDQTINFMGKAEDGWWRGRVGGRVGIFRSNLVEMVYEDPQQVTRTGDETVAATVETKDRKNTPLTREPEDRAKQPGERTEDCEKLAKQMEEAELTISDLQKQVHTALGAEEMVKNLTTKYLNLEDQVREALEMRTNLTRELEDRAKQLSERTKDCEKLAK